MKLSNVILKMKKRIVYYLFLVVFSILYYVLIYTGTTSSDYLLYSYKFSFNPVENAPWPLIHEKVTSLWDIFYSQCVHYLYVNGRSIVHAIIQLFTSFLGYDVCCLIATIMFALTLLLAEKVCFRRKVQTWIPRYVMIVGVFVFCCAPATIYSIVGTINYIWPLTFGLLFILWFDKPLCAWQKCLFFLVALIAGWSHEAFAAPLASTFFVFLLLERKRIKPYQVIGIVLLLMGTTATIISPGNFVKFLGSHGMGHVGVKVVILTHLKMFLYLRLTYVLFIVVVYLSVKKELYPFIVKYKYWFIAFVVSFIFILLVGAINARSTFFIEMIAGGILCIFIGEYVKPLSQHIIIVVITLISIPVFVLSSYYRSKIKETVKETEQLLATTPDKIVKINVTRTAVPDVLLPFVGYSQGKNEIVWTWQNTVYEFVYEKEEIELNYIDSE